MTRRAVWTVACVAVLVLLQSVFRADHVPLGYQALVIAVAITAAVRPDMGLSIVALLAPLGHLLSTRIWPVYPLGLAEAVTLAFFAGYLWWNRRLSTPRGDGIATAVQLFVVIVIASAVVQVTVLQRWHAYPLEYVREFVRFLTDGYLTSVPDRRPWVDGRGFVTDAALLIEGLGLMLCTRTLCARYPSLVRQLAMTVIVAGLGVGISSFVRLALMAGNDAGSAADPLFERVSPLAIPSRNGAGAYLLLPAFVAVGAALGVRRHRWFPAGALAICVAAVWLTKTRAAIVAAIATLTAAAVMAAGHRLRLRPSRTVMAAAGAAVALSVIVIVFNPMGLLAPRAREAIDYRRMFAATALGMTASDPLFGVGIGQYINRSVEFSPPELLESYSSSEAHNNVLLVVAELGVVGGGVFLFILGLAAVRLWTVVRGVRADPLVVGITAGLAAFVVTWLSYQPLVIPQAAFTFWILLGVALATVPRDAAATRPSWLGRAAAAALAVMVVASVPGRAIAGRSQVDLANVTYGLFNWETDPRGRAFRWTGPRATFHIPSDIRSIEVPVTASLDAAPEVTVEAYVNGRLAHRGVLARPWWDSIELRSPREAGPVWTVELRVSPTWIPRETLENSSDGRELGVRIGEIPGVLVQPRW